MSDKKKMPDWEVCLVKDVEGSEKGRWTKIGIGYNGQTVITVFSDLLPAGTKLILSKPKPREEKVKSADPFVGG